MKFFRRFTFATFLLMLVKPSDGLAVISIDLGSEFFKVAIVKPGVPMEIILNRESQRKTPTVLAMRDGERLFGDPAVNTGVRYPKLAFPFLMQLIGRKYDDPQVDLYKKRYPHHNLIEDEERGTVKFKIDDETSYSVEELLAMIIENGKDFTEHVADHPIKDAVITVPAYFNQAERKALMYAANLTGLNVLQMMSDNAAVALNYGVFRRKMFNSTMQYYLFYDMGATSTVATVVGYQVVKMKEGYREEKNPQLSIKGVGFDRNLGGLEVSMRLRDHLAKEFNRQKKTKTDVFTNHRAMAKLLKEAERVKKVLSANNEHRAQVEGLLDEKDFAAMVSREDLEKLCSDLFERVTQPLEDALKLSEITMNEINEVILMGGSTRIPIVQEKLLKYIKRDDLGRSINTDEAAAMGAVYQAAYLGKGYKVKTFNVKEGVIYPVVVEFDSKKTDDNGKEVTKHVKRTLFGRMNPFPQRKVMTFNKHTKDFSFGVSYGELDFLTEAEKRLFRSSSLHNISLSGVEAAFTKHGEGSESKGVKAHFRMDESGILHLDKVESVFEKMKDDKDQEEESAWSKLGSTFTGLFGSSDKKEKPESPSKKTDKPGDLKSEQNSSETTQGEKPTSEQEKKEEDATKSTKEGEKADSTSSDTSKKDSKDEGTKEGKKDEKKSEGEETKNGKDKTEEKADKNNTKSEEAAKPIKPVTVREDINILLANNDIPDPSKASTKASKKKLENLKTKDKERRQLQEIKNELESYIYEVTDKLTQEDYEKCSTEDERQKLQAMFSEASDWQYEQPDDATKKIFADKLTELKNSMNDLEFRVSEMRERPRALAALKSMFNHTEHFLKSVKNLSVGEDPVFTEVEVTTLETLIKSSKKWRADILKEQEKTPAYEKPKLLIEDIAEKINALDREVKYLINKAKTFKPKPKTTPDSNDTVADTDNSTMEETTTSDTTKGGESENDDVTVETEDDNGQTEKSSDQIPSPDTTKIDKDPISDTEPKINSDESTETTPPPTTTTAEETKTHEPGEL